MTMRFAARWGLTAAVVLTAACVKQNEIPSLMGPSGPAFAVSISATPDSITQDGYSQSSLVIVARDAAGKALPGVTFRLDMLVDGLPADYGRLSARTVVSGSDGRALAVYTAPPAPPPSENVAYCGGLPGPCVGVTATPIGSNFETSSTEAVLIRLVPQGVILPPADTPTAGFVFSPGTPILNQSVLFDAGNSCAGSEPCSSTNGIVSFDWSFGDGGAASGPTVTHTFTQTGSYAVTLTVTNERGRRDSETRTISIGNQTLPGATIVITPTPVVAGSVANLAAVNPTFGNGTAMASFTWSMGDTGGPAGTPTVLTGPNVSMTWPAPGTYTVILTLVNDIGQTRQISQSVTVQ